MGHMSAQERQAALKVANDLECWARTLRDIGNGEFVPPPPPPPPYSARAVELERLLREAVGEPGQFIGREGAENALLFFSRLAESGWFKRARAALTS